MDRTRQVTRDRTRPRIRTVHASRKVVMLAYVSDDLTHPLRVRSQQLSSARSRSRPAPSLRVMTGRTASVRSLLLTLGQQRAIAIIDRMRPG
jgi:hypothetical protein